MRLVAMPDPGRRRILDAVVPECPLRGAQATQAADEPVDLLATWLPSHTFHHREFEAELLVEAKQRAAVSISVCLPAQDEGATIARVVQIIRDALCLRVPLIDELIVIDGSSTDNTVQQARSQGASVIRENEILPELSLDVGKGEALWKSLYVCRGDILCWLDADTLNMSPHFVLGLLGPLLANEDIQYVKGFYERPLRHGSHGELHWGDGGRVTELLARPLLNAFWPHLAGLAQPLAGEFAGRRELLERIPFYGGYGVELGLLVEILHASGLQSIAQVDLERRIHRNQGLAELSRMSFRILQTALAILASEGRLDDGSWSLVLNQFVNSRSGYGLESVKLGATRLPPLNTLEEYRRRR